MARPPWPGTHTQLAAAGNHYLVATLGADKVGTQAAGQADHDGAEYRAPETDDIKSLHKPAGEVKHGGIEQ